MILKFIVSLILGGLVAGYFQLRKTRKENAWKNLPHENTYEKIPDQKYISK